MLRNREDIFFDYWMKYSTEFDLYTDVILILYKFSAKLFFLSRLIWEDSKEAVMPKEAW